MFFFLSFDIHISTVKSDPIIVSLGVQKSIVWNEDEFLAFEIITFKFFIIGTICLGSIYY